MLKLDVGKTKIMAAWKKRTERWQKKMNMELVKKFYYVGYSQTNNKKVVKSQIT